MTGRKGKREEVEDDGRSYADMNVPGMPWYRPPQSTDGEKGDIPELGPEGYKWFIWGALRAGLLIAAIFGGVYFLFILFLDKIVFKN